MEKTRRSWVRGAIVLGLSGTMMAAALMSPALAVRLATTGYVKQKINQAISAFRTEAQNAFIEDGLQYGRFVFAVPAGTATSISLGCPSGTKVTGGGGAIANVAAFDTDLEQSYPSNGSTTQPGTTGWTVTIENPTGTAYNGAVYAICARATGTANYPESGAPAKFSVSTTTQDL